MVNLFSKITNWLRSIKLPKTPAVNNAVAKTLPSIAVKPAVVSQSTGEAAAPAVLPVAPAALKFDTVQNSQISVRLLCAQNGLTVGQQAEVYAVIEAESGFNNTLTHPNIDPVTKKLDSTDYGICQVNDEYHIGIGKDFPSVAFVLENPQDVVVWMIEMYKAGKIDLWSAYENGSYKKYLPQSQGAKVGIPLVKNPTN